MYLSPHFYDEIFVEWEWQNILLDYQTGCGKTEMIIKKLLPYCQKHNKSVLYLSNRKTLNEHITQKLSKENYRIITAKNIDDLEKNSNNFVVTNLLYQNIENRIKSDSIDSINYKFDYIIADECHYFLSDSSFNSNTFLSFMWILNQRATRIWTSATMDGFQQMLEAHVDKGSTRHLFSFAYYDYISKIYSFSPKYNIHQIISRISDDEKILVFTTAKKAHELHLMYKESSAFFCSEGNLEYEKYITDGIAKQISSEENFGKYRILFATTVIDNGISITDQSVKHIIIDIWDKTSIIQCLGRRRINRENNDTVNVYFCDYNKQLHRKLNELNKKIEPLLFYIRNGEREYAKKYTYTHKHDDFVLNKNINHDSPNCLIPNSCKLFDLSTKIAWIKEILDNANSITKKEIIRDTMISKVFTPHVVNKLQFEQKSNSYIRYLCKILEYPQDAYEILDNIEEPHTDFENINHDRLNQFFEQYYLSESIIHGDKKTELATDVFNIIGGGNFRPQYRKKVYKADNINNILKNIQCDYTIKTLQKNIDGHNLRCWKIVKRDINET